MPLHTDHTNGCAILHEDGMLFHIAPNVESAEFICLVLNSNISSTDDLKIPEPPLDHTTLIQLKSELVKDGEAAYTDKDSKKAYFRGVSHTLDSLLQQQLIRVNHNDPPDFEVSDSMIDDVAKQLLGKATKKGNFFDGLLFLVNFLKKVKRQGRIILIDEREINLELLLRKVWCKTCEEEGTVDGVLCSACRGALETDPSMQEIRERYEFNYGKK